VVGYQPHRLRNAEFRHFMLQDLDDDQIGIFLDRWHEVTFDRAQKTEAENKRERLEKAIINSKSIRQLAGNPLLLTMMAVLNRHQELPRDRVDLYQQCSRLLLYQWDMERALGDFPGLSAEIGLREKTEILRVVAYAMQTRVSDKSRANYIDGNTLTELIEDYLCTKLRFEQARAVARALVQQLRKRNFILCFLGADSYAFVHRTFLEYFCAAEIVQQFNVAKTLEEQGLIDLFDKHCRDDDWHEVLRLICGQIDETFVSQVVDNLTMLTPKNEWHIEKAMPEISLALYCLSEVRSTSKLSKSATKLFERILDVYQEHAGNNVNEFRESLLNASRELVGVFSNSYTDINRILAVAKSFGESQEDGGIVAIGLNFPSFVANALNSREALEKMIGTTNPIIQSQVPKILIERWSDESTHSLLVECATQNHFIRLLRSAALQALAEKWPDETTRIFLTQRAVDDEHEAPRSAALTALAEK
ncbi:MAG: hypothetical protein AAGE92_03535, partial [Cyanobacteria bacterium P01_G01_bin.4]